MTEADASSDLARTPLFGLHRELGARLVPFAGYEMPVQYPAGILAEHRQCREAAALFDVSHMGQVRLPGAAAVAELERLVPCDIAGAAENAIRYSFFTNEAGGILDDLMITREVDGLFLVVNAARKDHDIAHLRAHLRATEVEVLDDRALLALQGPQAAAVLARLAPGVERLTFMTSAAVELAGAACHVSRSGYTGEDGYEISVPADRAEALARRLLAEPEVAPAGLGARDSLRLEAGLCLYGHDIDETTTPVEARLVWAIHKRRRSEGGFPGAGTILRQMAEGPPRKRVGLRPEGRAPAREGTEIVEAASEAPVGRVTSGGFGPTVGGPVAMGYVETRLAEPGNRVDLLVRGRSLPAEVVRLPFVKANYYRG